MARLWCGAESVRSSYARCRLGPKLMTRCRPESKDTKQHGEMLKIVHNLEEGRVPDRNAKGWKVEGRKRRVTRKECNRMEHMRQVLGETVEGST